MNNEEIFSAQSTEPKPGFSAHLVDFIQTLVVFAAIGTAIYFFIAQPHKVSGSSMVPNFDNGDYIITDKINYRVGEPKKGDIIVFKNPRDESQDFIKRIIGVPGDRAKVDNGQVFVNDVLLEEKYLPAQGITLPGAFAEDGEEIVVEKGKYFVLGDNRNHSSDSREWGFISKEEIIGKVFLRYWPQTAFGFIKSATY